MKRFLKILAWLAGIIAFLFFAVGIILSPKVLGKIVDTIVPSFIDGKLEHGTVRLDVFSRFPKVRVFLDDVSLTYPAGRFASLDSLYCGVDERMMAGNGPDADTLASFSKLIGSINIIELIYGKIRVPDLTLEDPRAFFKFYNDSTSNLSVFKTGSEKDTTSASIPKISVDKITLGGNTYFSCCFPDKEIFMDLAFDSIDIKGRIKSYRWEDMRVKLAIDTLMFSAAVKKDRYALDLKSLDVRARERAVSLAMDAKARTVTRLYGPLDLPLDIKVAATLPHDTLLVFDLDNFNASLAGIPLSASGKVSISPLQTNIDAGVKISDCSLDTLATHIGAAYWSGLYDAYFKTMVNLEASCKGSFIPATGEKPVLDAKINKLDIDGEGLNLSLNGSVSDILRGDAVFDIDASLDAVLDTLKKLIPEELGVNVGGNLALDLKGRLSQSQLDFEHIARSNLTALVRSDAFRLSLPSEAINVSLSKLEASVEGSLNKSGNDADGQELTADIDLGTVSINIKNNTFVSGNGVVVALHDDASNLSFNKNDLTVYPIGGRVYADRLSMISGGKTLLGLKNTTQDFNMIPKEDNPRIPVLTMTSSNKEVFLKSQSNRIRMENLDLSATAVMNGIQRKTRIVQVIDSLSRENPTVPRDSLMIYIRRARKHSKDTPSWMREKDFKKYDISFNLNDNFKKVFMEWDLNSRLNLDRGTLMTPYFPLRTSVSSLGCSISNNEIMLDSLKLVSGETDLSLYGDLNDLRRFLFGGGTADLDFDIKSGNIDLNEILGAIHKGSKLSAEETAALSKLSDSQYEAAVITDTITTAQPLENALIVLPGNIDVNVNVDAGYIKNPFLDISSFSTHLAMKERCLQVTNTVATSDIADLFLEGFYSTKSKDDLKAGFSLSLMDITAEKVIELVPAFDTIVPILKNLSGLVNLDLAATSSIDTTMNLIIPSLTGVIRVGGKDLAIYDSEQFRQLARILMFKNKNSAFVDELSIEGLLFDSKLEVYPFVVNMDRYQLAISGLQNLDTSFKYHASVLHSPLFFRFGIDLTGDFKKSRVSIGLPKYKSAESIPVFSSVIDDSRINLSKSIKNIFREGVEAAIKENQEQEAIAEFKEKNNYVAAIDIQLDSLSQNEFLQIDSLASQSDTISIEDAVLRSY